MAKTGLIEDTDAGQMSRVLEESVRFGRSWGLAQILPFFHFVSVRSIHAWGILEKLGFGQL
jgi:hypothetical protein